MRCIDDNFDKNIGKYIFDTRDCEKYALGTVVLCDGCNHIRAEQYQSEEIKRLYKVHRRTRFLFEYEKKYGLCKSCIERKRLWILEKQDIKTIENYKMLCVTKKPRRLEASREVIRRFREELTPDLLKSLNPEATKRYLAKWEKDDCLMARMYIKEIRKELYGYLRQCMEDALNQNKEAREEIERLREAEEKMYAFLEKTRGYCGFCVPIEPWPIPVPGKYKKSKRPDEKGGRRFLMIGEVDPDMPDDLPEGAMICVVNSEMEGRSIYYVDKNENIIYWLAPFPTEEGAEIAMQDPQERDDWVKEEFERLCKGREQTEEPFYERWGETREHLRKIVEEAMSYKTIGDLIEVLERHPAMQKVWGALPRKLADENFWK